jgi:7-carboxy-7-deazaguanine synthase
MKLVEKFISINGEGAHAGELAVFLRFKGCNLNCSYCDTCWANTDSAEAEDVTPSALAEWVRDTGVRNVTLTGGEPLLQPNIAELTSLLMGLGCRVEYETNGSISLAKFAEMRPRPVFTMDYKLPSSGMERFMRTENFKLLGCHDTVKFVSGSIEDLERAKEIIEEYSLINKCHVYLSPVFGSIDPAKIVEFMADNHMNGVRLQLQLHKFIWEPERRGV